MTQPENGSPKNMIIKTKSTCLLIKCSVTTIQWNLSLSRTSSGPQNSVSYREVSTTKRFFWPILLQKLALVCCVIVQLNPNCVKRSVVGEEQAKRQYIRGYHAYNNLEATVWRVFVTRERVTQRSGQECFCFVSY